MAPLGRKWVAPLGCKLTPLKHEAVLLNLSQKDCVVFQSSNPKPCFFKSIYKYSNFYSLSGYPSIEFEEDDSQAWPDRLYDGANLTIGIPDDKLEDKDYLSSIEQGLRAITGSNYGGYGRRFVLFKDEFCMPEKGTTLVDVEVQSIQENDLRIADQELFKFQNNRDRHKVKVIKPYFGLDLGSWCSATLKLLINLALRICEHDFDRKAIECFRKQNYSIELEKLKSIGKIINPDSPAFMDHFFKLAFPDKHFYKGDLVARLNKGSVNTVNLGPTSDSEIPSVLKELIRVAQYISENNKHKEYPKQSAIEGDFVESGFPKKLAKYASSIISRSPRSDGAATKADL